MNLRRLRDEKCRPPARGASACPLHEKIAPQAGGLDGSVGNRKSRVPWIVPFAPPATRDRLERWMSHLHRFDAICAVQLP